MYSTNNALALATTGTPKSARKASDISKSPHRGFNSEEENWPELEAANPTSTPTTRSQGTAKRGKSEDGSQRKLDKFFALAKQPSLSSPPKLSSLGSTHKNPSGIRNKNLVIEVQDNDDLASNSGGQKKLRVDPPTDMDKTSTKNGDNKDSNEEYEAPLSNIKLRPKSKATPAKTASSTKKPRKANRSSVGFEAPTPAVQLVDPDPPVITKIDHPHRTVLTTTVRVDKVKDSLTNFTKKLMETIAFLRDQVDDTIAIVPKESGTEFDHITDIHSFPTVVYKLNQRYFNIETRGAFTDASKTQTGRTVKLSLVLGSTVEMDHNLLEEIRFDIQAMGVNFWYKPHQEVDTTSRIVFLGAPNNANKDEVLEIINNTLQPLERHLVDTDPSVYKPEVHGLPWPKFAIISEQPTGQPFTNDNKDIGPDGKVIMKAYVPPPSERRSIHIMCKRSDYRRLATLVIAAKAKNMWLKVFGMCYPVEAPDHSYSKQQGRDYLKMADVHESAQLSYGTFRISGLTDPGKQSTLRRTIGDPITVSVRQIMRMITTPRRIVNGKVVPGDPVWLCVLLSDNGAYTGYYAGPNKRHQIFASAFTKCPAAQIYFFLCRHGILQQDVDRFIRHNFSMAQLRLVSKATYNRKTGLATVPVQPGEENILDAARLDNSLVDLTKLTKRDFEDEEEEETGEYKGPAQKDPDCYNFSSAQSITTIQNGTDKVKFKSSGKSVKSVALGESVCSIGTQEDVEDDEEDTNAAALALDPLTKMRNEEVQFDLSFMEQSNNPTAAATNGTSSTDENEEMEEDDEGKESEDDDPSASKERTETDQIWEKQRQGASTDAALAAAMVGLDLTSVTSEVDTAELSFAIVLAGEGRSFQEMYDILDSLREEVSAIDEATKEALVGLHTHIPQNIRDLLTTEAEANEETELEQVLKIRNWLTQAEEIEAEEAGEERGREREYDEHGSLLPRTEEYGDEEPQGSGTSTTTSRTTDAMVELSADSSATRLGAYEE